MYVKWNLVLVCLEIVLVSAQDRCTICTKHSKGSEIILTHLMVLQGDVSQSEAHFNPFGDSVNIGARFVPNIP
jgi:hypothetical protein